MASEEVNIVSIQVDEEQKRILEAAASIKGLALSRYLLSIALHAAKEATRSTQLVSLSDESRDAILPLLENPPEPSAPLLRLFS